MEELLVLAIQFLAELILQILIYMPFDVPLSRNEKTGERRGCGWVAVYITLGVAVAGLSLLVVPRLLINSPSLRVANLVIAPLAAGGFSAWVASWRRAKGATVSPTTHFLTGFWFVLAFAGVRLVYATR